jgi:Glycosyltransferase 61
MNNQRIHPSPLQSVLTRCSLTKRRNLPIVLALLSLNTMICQLFFLEFRNTVQLLDEISVFLEDHYEPAHGVWNGLDLGRFVPMNNASTTFTLDDFQFLALKEQHPLQETGSTLSDDADNVWTVPDIDNAEHYLSSSTVRSIVTNGQTNTSEAICQVICRFERLSFSFPHFLQQALPCFSVIHYVASKLPEPQKSKVRYYMMLPDFSEVPNGVPPYISSFLNVLEGSPYHIQMIYGFHKAIPIHPNCDNKNKHLKQSAATQDETTSHQQELSSSSSSSSSSVAILAIKAFDDSGWFAPTRYFLSDTPAATDDTALAGSVHDYKHYNNEYEAIQKLQQSVLGMDQYRAGPSSTFDKSINNVNFRNQWYRESRPNDAPQDQNFIQVLVLDRKPSRCFEHVDDTVHALQNYSYITANKRSDGRTRGNNSVQTYRLNVTYVSSFHDFTLYDQALFIHRADVIYSPHGAQLSNLIYIRPCTVVVEFLPRYYYLQFFQAIVANARGLAYEVYPTIPNGIDRVTETQENIGLHSQVRVANLNISSDFFLSTFPTLMQSTMQCRINYSRDVQ